MNDGTTCPLCPPGVCKGYAKLWDNLRRPDGHRWRAIHDQINGHENPETDTTPEDLALRAYVVKHGGCCGG